MILPIVTPNPLRFPRLEDESEEEARSLADSLIRIVLHANDNPLTTLKKPAIATERRGED